MRGSIEEARKHASKHGVENVDYHIQVAKELPGEYDLVTLFDCLHDTGDPVSALKRAKGTLKPDGTVMNIEPMAVDSLSENLNPIGRLSYSASTMVCVVTSLAQETGLALGAQAGEKRLRILYRDARPALLAGQRRPSV
jgi:2-polyprenyl-3-methyl-5-hydroxy-6-metoxy-1,4-benzoquinol methylase